MFKKIMPLLLLLVFAGCAAQVSTTPGKEIPLTGAVNVRDLGGYETVDGHKIKPQRLLRGAQLGHLTTADIQKLTKEEHLDQIVDFRTESEVAQLPDPEIKEVSYLHDPIMKDTGQSTSMQDFMANLSQLENPESYLIQANQQFVTDPFARKGYRQFFDTLLANETGATLWHCTASKDRAGFGTALVLSALGVPKETVVKDYLLSNDFREEENQKTLAQMKGADEKAREAMRALLEVRPSYIEAAFEQMEQDYGSVEGYLTKGLGLSQQDLQQLKKLYLA